MFPVMPVMYPQRPRKRNNTLRNLALGTGLGLGGYGLYRYYNGRQKIFPNLLKRIKVNKLGDFGAKYGKKVLTFFGQKPRQAARNIRKVKEVWTDFMKIFR